MPTNDTPNAVPTHPPAEGIAGYGLRIYIDGDDHEVWVGPADDLAAGNILNSFILGIGSTRDAAVANAVKELEALETLLQSPPGVIPEVDVTPPAVQS